METLGLTLSEGKTLLAGVQDFVVAQQVQQELEQRRACPHCGQRFRCDPRLAGRTLPCPRCGRQLLLTPPPTVPPAGPLPPGRQPDHDSSLDLP